MADPRQRWDTDDRFAGVADASAFAAAIEELAALARRPGWVAEEPEVHLVPHLRNAQVAGLRLAGAPGRTVCLTPSPNTAQVAAAATCGGKPGR